MRAWMRELKITLTSDLYKKKVTYGTNYNDGTQPDLDITVTGTKYMSALKDNFTVTISNLTYKQIVELVYGQFYKVKIQCGYRDSGYSTIFEGGVLYISNNLGDHKTNKVVILCASEVVAIYGQQRLNLSLNSGINMYSALKYICMNAGIYNSNISDAFKLKVIEECYTQNATVGSILESLTEDTSYATNSDNSLSDVISIWDTNNGNLRKIPIDENTIIMTNGYPTLSTDGVNMTLMPTFNFQCGDIIILDNSLVDMSVTDKSTAYKNLGYYLDENGEYMVYQITYNLTNRSDSFSMEMQCRSRALVSGLLE